MKIKRTLVLAASFTVCCFATSSAFAQSGYGDSQKSEEQNACAGLPDQSALKGALIAATQEESSGLNNQMWATIVDRDGVVCAVAFSGVNRGAQWPGSRVISAQKANTANAFSLDKSSYSEGSGEPDGLALSTANLYSATQPGGSLFGLLASNPVNVEAAYRGPSAAYGTNSDPLVGHKIGGVNVFGGGLALFTLGHAIAGGVGVSGDTSCADHNISWRVRHILNLDHLAASNSNAAVFGISGDASHPDNIIFDITPNPNGGTGISAGGFGHPTCLNTANPKTLPVVQP